MFRLVGPTFPLAEALPKDHLRKGVCEEGLRLLGVLLSELREAFQSSLTLFLVADLGKQQSKVPARKTQHRNPSLENKKLPGNIHPGAF